MNPIEYIDIIEIRGLLRYNISVSIKKEQASARPAGGSSEMRRLKILSVLLSALLTAGVATAAVVSTGPPSAQDQTQAPVYEELAGTRKKCWIGQDYFFTYEFDHKPKMGTAILVIKLFDKEGERRTDMEIVGNSGMPSMSGAHDSGDVPFQLNKKGNYLLPISVVMAGEWEVKLTFLKDEKIIFRGKFRFHV